MLWISGSICLQMIFWAKSHSITWWSLWVPFKCSLTWQHPTKKGFFQTTRLFLNDGLEAKPQAIHIFKINEAKRKYIYLGVELLVRSEGCLTPKNALCLLARASLYLCSRSQAIPGSQAFSQLRLHERQMVHGYQTLNVVRRRLSFPWSQISWGRAAGNATYMIFTYELGS